MNSKEMEKLITRKKELQAELKEINAELKAPLDVLKSDFKELGKTELTIGIYLVKYTPDRKYLFLKKKLPDVREAHPEWVEEREGYSKLTFTTTEVAWLK